MIIPVITIDVSQVKEAWQNIVSNILLAHSAKQTIARRYLDYLIDIGADVKEILQVQAFAEITLSKAEESRKRARENGDDYDAKRMAYDVNGMAQQGQYAGYAQTYDWNQYYAQAQGQQ
jgi:hypothetical protein